MSTAADAPRARRHAVLAAFALVSFLAGTFVYTTLEAFGPGLTFDSAGYIGSARSLARSGTLEVPHGAWWSATPTQPLLHFPPLYPIALSLFERAGLDAIDGARLLNAVLAALTLFLGLALVGRAAAFTPSARLAAASLLLALTMLARSPGILFLHAWSEPLFLALLVGFLLALVRSQEAGAGWGALVAVGALTGLACLTRKAGVFLLPVALLAAVRQPRPPGPRPLAARVVATLLAFGVVYGPWLFRRGESVLGFSPDSTRTFWEQQLGFLGTCVLRLDSPPALARVAGAALYLVILAFLLSHAGLSTLVRGGPHPDPASWPAATAILHLLLIAAVAATYLPGLSDVDGRLMAPFFLAAVLAFGLSFVRADAGRRPGWGAAALAALLLASSAYRAFPRFRQAATWGLGFERQPWRDSSMLAWLREHGSAYPALFSNQPAGLYFGTGRPAYRTLTEAELDRLLEFRRKLEAAPSLVVAFDDETPVGRASHALLAQRAGLVPLHVFPDGTVYVLPAAGTFRPGGPGDGASGAAAWESRSESVSGTKGAAGR